MHKYDESVQYQERSALGTVSKLLDIMSRIGWKTEGEIEVGVTSTTPSDE